MTLLQEEFQTVEIEADLTCDEDSCSTEAKWRSIFLCCSEGSLMCDTHKRALQNYLNLHGKHDATCSEHGLVGPLKNALKIFPL